MNKTIILPSYVSSNIKTELEKTSIHKMKDYMLDACRKINNDGIDIKSIQAAITNIPDEASLDDIMLIYTALEHYGNINKDDPEKTVYEPKYSDIAKQLDDIQTALYNMMLKIKFAQGYDYVIIRDPQAELEFEDYLEKLMFDMIGFRDLLHVSLEGIRSGSVGPDEIENAVGSLYFLSGVLTERFVGIREKFFPQN